MIKILNLEKTFKSTENPVIALKNVSLCIETGKIFGIIGMSGAGKSTLIRTINGLETPDSGSVIVDDIEVTNLKGKTLNEFRKDVGMIFQHFNLLDSRDVAGNVSLPMELKGLNKNEIADRISEVLEWVGLTDKKHSAISKLSGGQKQRVAIARALANSPKILLCDEATSALDPKTTLEILNLLKELREKLQITIVLITHEMDVIKKICDEVAVIEQGEIVELGEVTRVFEKPEKKVTRTFVKAV